MWQLGNQVTNVAGVKNAGRRFLAAAAAIVLLAAVRQLITEQPGIAGVVFAGLLVGAAAFLLTFVVRPESAFFLRDAQPEPVDPAVQPEILDLTEQDQIVEPVPLVQPERPREPNPVIDLTHDSGDSAITPEAITPEAM